MAPAPAGKASALAGKTSGSEQDTKQLAQEIPTFAADPACKDPKKCPGEPHWPANRQDYVPPLMQYFDQLKTWLQTTKQQLPVVGVVAILGFVNVVFGPAALRVVITLVFSSTTVAS